MEDQKQWRIMLAKKVGGEGDKYIPSQMGQESLHNTYNRSVVNHWWSL